MEKEKLTFEILDDLALAAVRRRGNPESYLGSLSASRLGPLIELMILSRATVLPLAALAHCPTKQLLTHALDPHAISSGNHLANQTLKVGFVLTSRNPLAIEDPGWVYFCRKAQEAAELSLPKHLAQGFIGAMREIEDNIHVHSGRSQDGVIGYRGTSSEFEFVVADSGMGILNSLKQSPHYVHYSDSGSAIRTALADGESRFIDEKPGHGFGFRDLFVGLANLNGELRFRSGDHALTIDGRSPSLITANLNQKVECPGFITSIVCAS